MAVNLFTGATDSNWGTSTNWSQGTVPTASDGHTTTFDGTSPACTVNASNRVAQVLDFTGYTNTITMSFDISVSGAMTFSATMTISGSGWMRGIIAATHTSNGKTIPNLWFSGTVTHTLADNFDCTNLRLGFSSNSTTVNANQITISGNLDRSQASTGVMGGTTTLIMAGTGTIIAPSSTAILRNPLTINTAGTITFPSGTFRYDTGTFTYTAGTVVVPSDVDLGCNAATAWNTGGTVIQFRDCTWPASAVAITLNSDFYCRDFTSGLITTVLTFNGNNMYISRNMSLAAMTSGSLTGTTVFNLTGTGNITTDAATTGRIMCPMIFNTTGTITLVSALSVSSINFYNFKYVQGTVVGLYTWPAGGGSFTFS